MNKTDRKTAFNLYLILGGLFVALLVACNLIFQKFFYWSPLESLSENNPISSFTFEISVGILPYPLTFLLTDIISEIYGRKRANLVVMSGLVSSVVVFLIVLMAQLVPATSWSPVSDQEFEHVFGRTGIAVGASMAAYLLAQFIDIRIFHFWKNLTKGKHLWLRNNFSTWTSQFIDTFVVLFLLCSVGAIEWEYFGVLMFNGVLFKVLVALLDTPLLYLSVYFLRRRFKLSEGQEIPEW
jgi:queuosine precursor transporter